MIAPFRSVEMPAHLQMRGFPHSASGLCSQQFVTLALSPSALRVIHDDSQNIP